MSATLTHLPSPSQEPLPEGKTNRWAFWRSPAGQPPWARPALLGIALVALVLYAWNLPVVDYAPLYSEAVRSMSGSWKAFLYGAIDPAATYTLDKLAGSFVPQVISAKIFGYSEWSLALPQVIEGVISVLVMYRVVRRWAGVTPGLIAAGIFTLTPVAASMFGHSMHDGFLTMCLVLAVDQYQRAVLDGRLRSLVWAGVWVGIGFQAKMLQAWMILPALVVGYLLSAPIEVRRRVKHVAVAGVVTLAVSLSWVALYTFTPASERPYVDGSTNNSAFAMVFGYNGLARLGINLPGARVVSETDVPVLDPNVPPPPMVDIIPTIRGNPWEDPTKAESRESPKEWGKLFDGHLAIAVGWLFPLVLMTLVCGLWWWRRSERTDPVRGGLVMWGVWLLTFGLIFSAGEVPHTAYVASLAPAVAALSALGIVMFWQSYRRVGRQAWLLPGVAAAELAWGAWLWSHYPNFLPWAMWSVIALGAVAVVALVLVRVLKNASSSLVTAALAIGVASILAAPATYAFSVLDPDYAGASYDANAGPESGKIPGGPESGEMPVGGEGGMPGPGGEGGMPGPGGGAPGPGELGPGG
ncbi:glycosyltransferase family 39 protein [Kibdelosporangium philippinense]|uniref:Glycosyltransferase family 39 protein n=1 Tax=Kibdelosporangium philippinense TaxID=211113 RepID=A0ABS8Z5J9_9PSEU|nr:glycosyltransferase family 39 protein [Kibdelosporangium philippinense]MCE7003156.1 glycosyltransferase family 39 protein [Kibdelosporangium philippinense]